MSSFVANPYIVQDSFLRECASEIIMPTHHPILPKLLLAAARFFVYYFNSFLMLAHEYNSIYIYVKSDANFNTGHLTRKPN